MGPLIMVLTVLLLLTAITLVALILLQRGRGSGMVGFGGGVEQAFGTRATTLAQKATVLLGILFLVLAVVVGLLRRHRYQAPTSQSPSEAQRQPEGEQ